MLIRLLLFLKLYFFRFLGFYSKLWSCYIFLSYGVRKAILFLCGKGENIPLQIQGCKLSETKFVKNMLPKTHFLVYNAFIANLQIIYLFDDLVKWSCNTGNLRIFLVPSVKYFLFDSLNISWGSTMLFLPIWMKAVGVGSINKSAFFPALELWWLVGWSLDLKLNSRHLMAIRLDLSQ